ncbi:MAG: hypothetical protein BWY92_01165 [Firmicutes bacterium ADurb.BinA052]|nr:MAG: hypothetical protein BWY92_01165 [Firmicutes bacterium ADurb.BinA052]
MLLGKVLAIVNEYELPILDARRSHGCARIVRILQKLGNDMTRTLHLLEQLVPRSGQYGVLFKLNPTPGSSCPDILEIGRRIRHRGGPPLLSNSDNR